MNKRNAAAAANGGNEGSSTSTDESTGSGTFSVSNTSASERLRNPFGDDDDEEQDGSGSGSGSDDDDDDHTGNQGADTAEGSGGWNRGAWWRGVVGGGRRSNQRDTDSGEMINLDKERFGDGRDDSDDSDADEMEDEEFGDFAMPEVEGGGHGREAAGASASSGGVVTGIDPAREKLLLKPLPVHPAAAKTSGGPFGSLWPFSTQGFGTGKDKDKKDDMQGVSWGEPAEATAEKERSSSSAGASAKPVLTEEPVGMGEREVIVGEDGKKINRAVEAKRRTSIEDPDEDEVEVVEGVHCGGRAKII